MSINDPACGYGVMFIAARNFCIENGKNPHTNLFCVAQDIDFCAAMGCYIQMSLLGIAGYVRVGDSLSNPPTGNVFDTGRRCVVYPHVFPSGMVDSETI